MPTFIVVDVIDGDTLDLDNGERVRLAGIDAPERGDCGADAATATLTALALGNAVVLEPSDEDRDQYGRLLRYVVVDGVDAGGTLLMLGQAVPRYNSTDGYGRHPREDEYAAIAQPAITCAAPAPAPAPAPARSGPAAGSGTGSGPPAFVRRDVPELRRRARGWRGADLPRRPRLPVEVRPRQRRRRLRVTRLHPFCQRRSARSGRNAADRTGLSATARPAAGG